jgi:hypothetical protein
MPSTHHAVVPIRRNLELKTQPKQLLGSPLLPGKYGRFSREASVVSGQSYQGILKGEVSLYH